MGTTRWRAGLAVAIAAAMLSAACGNDDGETSNATQPNARSEPTTGASPTGEPIDIFFVNAQGSSTGINVPDVSAAAQAAVDYVNEELGGVGGRPLRLSVCDTDNTPEAARACGNRAVDERPDVVLKGVEAQAAALVPIVNGAGITYAAQQAGSQPELGGESSFIFTAGQLSLFAPVAAYADDEGWDRVSFLLVDVPSGIQAFQAFGQPVFDRLGVEVEVIAVQPTAADITPQFVAATEGADAVVVVGTDPLCIAAMQARQALSYDGPLFMSFACSAPAAAAAAGTTVDGLFTLAVDALADTSDDDVIAFEDALERHAPDVEPTSVNALGFAGVMNLHAAMSTAADPSAIDQASMADVLRNAGDLPLFLGGGATFRCDGTILSVAPAVCGGTAFIDRYEGESRTAVTTYDVAELLAQ